MHGQRDLAFLRLITGSFATSIFDRSQISNLAFLAHRYQDGDPVPVIYAKSTCTEIKYIMV